MRLAAAVIFCLMLCGEAAAQTWPARPVRLMVAQSPGSAPDMVSRWVADRLAQSLGRSFVVENILGSGGFVAAQTALRAGTSGYAYYLAGGGLIATDRHMYKSIPYDADRDFVPVAMLFDSGPFVVAVHPEVPARTLPELISLAKSQPGKLTAASNAYGITIITGQWFNALAGTDIVNLTYKSTSQLVLDLLAGRVQMGFVGLADVDQHIKAGKTRALAVTSDARFPTYPEVHTVAETLPGFKVAGIGLLVAPAGTPADIVQRLNRAIDPIVRDPKYTDYLLSFGWTNSAGARTLAGLNEFMTSERERWNDVFKVVHFEPQ